MRGGVTLTTKELNELGFNSPAITKLINEKIIKREKRGIYTLDSLEDVIYYAVSIIKERNKDFEQLINICYQIDPTNKDVVLEKMINEIFKNDYSNVFYLFKNLEKQKSFSREDTLLFLYLFQYFIPLDYYDEMAVKYLTLEDILLEETEENRLENKIRRSVYYNKFSYAIGLMKERTEYSLQDKVISYITHILATRKTEKLKLLDNFILKKQYKQAKKFLEEDYSFLWGNHENITFQLLEDSLDLEEGKSIETTSFNCESAKEAIQKRNYEQANQLITYNGSIKILLEDILEKQKSLKKVEFSDIVQSLLENKIEEAFYALDRYLEQLEKKEYKNLLMHLLKASTLENDLSYTKPMLFLAQVNENVIFDLSSYLQEYYKATANNNFALARVYLEIIEDANGLGLCNMNTESLNMSLNHLEGIIKEDPKNEKIKQLMPMEKKTEPFKEEILQMNNLLYEGKKLTEKNLNSIGITEEMIEEFIDKNMLKRIRRYEYEIIALDKSDNPYDLLKESIQNGNYKNAYEQMKELEKNEEIELSYQVKNTWLLLLRNFIDLDKEDKQQLQILQKIDLLVNPNAKNFDKNMEIRNKVVRALLKYDFSVAYWLLDKEEELMPTDYITKALLFKAKNSKENAMTKLISKVNEKDYEGIKENALSIVKYENVFFLLATDIIDMKEGRLLSNVNLSGENLNFMRCIKRKNYKSALEYLYDFYNEEGKEAIENMLNEAICLMEETKTIAEPISNDYLISVFNTGDMEHIVNTIQNYGMNRNDCNHLIMNLLKLDILEKDSTFKRTITELSNRQNASYTFSIENLLPEFYEAIGNQKRIEAGIYLDIIKNCEEYKNEEEFTQQLESIVEGMQKVSNVEYKIHSNFLKLFDGVELSNHITINQEPIKVCNTKTEDNKMRKFLIRESKKLEQNDGIILLDQKYTKYKEQIEEIIKDMDGIGILIYGKDDRKRIILRQTRRCENDLEWKELRDQAKAAYINKSYEKSLEINKDLLQIMPEAKTYLIFSVGLSYLKFRKLDKAIRLIKIADDITYAEDKEYHYTELLDSLMARSLRESGVKKVNIKELDFNENTYGLENVEEISSLLVQTGYNVEESCQKLNLNEEDTNIVKLLCAKDSFIDNMEDIGNKYLKEVEHSKNKTSKVKKIYGDIIKNKRVYLRSNSHEKTLLKEM